MFSLGRKLPSAGSLLVGILVGLLVATVSAVTYIVGELQLTCVSQLLRQGGDVRIPSVFPFLHMIIGEVMGAWYRTVLMGCTER